MPRRFPTQVHKQVSRLMRAGYIRQEPLWYKAVLDHPPLPLPPKNPAPRTEFDLKQSHSGIPKRLPRTQPLPVYYLEDDIRRQFFRDHPFETFRPTTLTEAGEIEQPHHVQNEQWTRLRQRGRNPRPEDAIQFALNLYTYHNMALTEAYKSAVCQFRALRAEHQIATDFAVMEAEQLGALFGPTAIEQGFEREKESLKTWEKQEQVDEGALVALKRWKAIVDKQRGLDQWSKGQEYVRLWREGIRPDYSLALTQPINTEVQNVNLS